MLSQLKDWQDDILTHDKIAPSNEV